MRDLRGFKNLTGLPSRLISNFVSQSLTVKSVWGDYFVTIHSFYKGFDFYWLKGFIALIAALTLAGCAGPPPERPDFSVISSPQIPPLSQNTPAPTPIDTPEPPAATPISTGPTLFQMSPTKVIPADQLPQPAETSTPTAIEPTPTEPPLTPTATPPPPKPKPTTPPDEPRRGGSWDLEEGFEVWINPFGDNCSGAKVAAGWQGFTSRGQYGSSCFIQNDYAPNVFSGRYSQLVTFDFVDSHAGLYRTFDTQPGHKYQVTAWLRHVHTLPAMQFHFGYDLTGGADWQASTVQWAPWDEFREDEWIRHEETFVAAGPKTTIYLKGFHDTASQGGATYLDAVEVIDLGHGP